MIFFSTPSISLKLFFLMTSRISVNDGLSLGDADQQLLIRSRDTLFMYDGIEAFFPLACSATVIFGSFPPLSMKNTTTPNEYTSTLPSHFALSLRSSGAMNFDVPMSLDFDCLWPSTSTMEATPKSLILTCPSMSNRMFSGLKWR